MAAHRCKAEPSQLLRTEFGEFTVDNRCWVRNGFSLTQVRVRQMAAYTQALGRKHLTVLVVQPAARL